jgi:hypothetical protein
MTAIITKETSMPDDAPGDGQHDAHVQVLTAEVRTLVVGSRQVTFSVTKQLDEVAPEDIKPFGRIRTGTRRPFGATDLIEVIGSSVYDGTLVRAKELCERYWCTGLNDSGRRVINGREAEIARCSEHQSTAPRSSHFWEFTPEIWGEWEQLPLIVLAGLR